MPHSRWNDLPKDALLGCGYRVLTRSDEVGVDAFEKRHPEYEDGSLLLEYRRDLKRFLHEEIPRRPSMPQGYFAGGVRGTWHPTAVRLYRNWLRHLSEQQSNTLRRMVRPGEKRVDAVTA
jgi:homoserine O-succinyltransferase